MSKKEKKSSGVGKFIAGAAVGATLGILFAPKSGKETRQDLKRIFDDFMKKVKEIDVQEVKEQLEAKIEEIRTGLADLDREKALKIAKEKATAVKEKCEELVQLAVAKGTPVLEKAADEVRSKTIEAVREILARLEESDRKAKAKS
ncbi:MAG TPA: YtxH domain-containing protein [Candidatus Scybalousia intestinigallinarum]|nr:YtxH domain-containing protein [Candidatus Scybalousia intestinigallinarum]